MTDHEALAYASADLWLLLFVTDLALGIALDRTGVYPGAVDVAVAIGGLLCVLVGASGLALVLLGRKGRGRQSDLAEWELGDERS